MWETILELRDGVPVKVEVDTGWVRLVRITESNQHIVLTLEGLAIIGEAVAQRLESAAEPLFIEEDLEADRQAIADLEVP